MCNMFRKPTIVVFGFVALVCAASVAVAFQSQGRRDDGSVQPADARVQRQEMIAELRAIRQQLQEATAVLREMKAATVAADDAGRAVRRR